ncbi:MAG: hypothetical protein JO354_05840 [Verrucomicrobia bacterium]|nr:hypothetical protein [Verrucomicrobiota bacterium]
MKSETIPFTPTSWHREASCACLRVETSAREARLFPYQQLVTASLDEGGESETLRLAFSSHDIEITGRNLRPLLIALQDYAVKWIRLVPDRYQRLAGDKNGIITSIRIEEPK